MSKPHYTSRAKSTTDDEEYSDHPSLSETIGSRLLPVVVSDQDETEQKRQLYTNLVRLKEQRKTHAQCAQELGVSVHTISNYVNDPLYKEIQADLIAEAKQRGHLLIAEVIDEAVSTVYGLMHNAKSEFVRYKAAEKLLDVAGYNLPREEAQNDSREGVLKFMQQLEAKRAGQPPVIVNVVQQGNVGTTMTEGKREETVVDADTVATKSIPPDLAQYYEAVQPGGKLPIRFTDPARTILPEKSADLPSYEPEEDNEDNEEEEE